MKIGTTKKYKKEEKRKETCKKKEREIEYFLNKINMGSLIIHGLNLCN
jgi:hypothetical protein